MIYCKFSFGPLQTNTILLGCSKTKKAAVIDPALGSTPAILKKCALLECTVDKILLTHSHWDHIADLHTLVQKTSAPVYVHSLDSQNVEQPGSDGIPLLMPIEGVKPNIHICDGDQILIGELLCEVIHSPGHSPGGVCYYVPQEKLLISGDTLFAGSIGALHFSTGEPEKMWESLKKISQLPADTRVVPGHGEDTLLSRENWLTRAREIFE